MSRTRLQFITAALLLLLCSTAAWAGFSTPVTFVANTPLLAAQLNSNFGAIAAALTSGANGNIRIGNASGTYTDGAITSTGGTITITPGSGTLNVDTAPSLMQHATISLSSSDIIGMYAAPKLLIAAPAAGKNIIVEKAMLKMVTTSTAFTGGGATHVQISNTVDGGGTDTTATFASGIVTAGAGTSYTVNIPVSYTGTAATGLYLSNDTAPFAAGTGTAVVDVWYQIQ